MLSSFLPRIHIKKYERQRRMNVVAMASAPSARLRRVAVRAARLAVCAPPRLHRRTVVACAVAFRRYR